MDQYIDVNNPGTGVEKNPVVNQFLDELRAYPEQMAAILNDKNGQIRPVPGRTIERPASSVSVQSGGHIEMKDPFKK